MVFRPNQMSVGKLADTGINDSLPYPALENIEGGRIVCFNDAKTHVRKPMANIATITLSADLVASDTFTAKVNGTNISVTYATSHLATVTAISNAIIAAAGNLFGNDKVSVTLSGSNRILTVRALYTAELTVTNALVTSGGAGTATTSVAYTSDDASRLAGISKDENWQPDTDGNVYASADEVVQVYTKGRIPVEYEGTLTNASTVYVRIEDEAGALQKRGMLKETVGSPVVAVAVSGLTIREVVSAENVAKIEVNLP